MSRLTSDDWVNAAVKQMAVAGVHAVRVEKLAQTLGVSKGSFYWHFQNRDALLAKMLQFWEHQGTESIIAQVDAQADNPQQRLQSLTELIFRWTPIELAFEIQVRAWATTDAQTQSAVHKVDRLRVSYIHRLLTEAKVPFARARAELVYSTFLGDMLRQSYGKEDIDRSQLRILRTQLLGLES